MAKSSKTISSWIHFHQPKSQYLFKPHKLTPKLTLLFIKHIIVRLMLMNITVLPDK